MADRHEHESSLATQADTVAQLIRAAGRREDPPAAVYERTLAAATTTWQAKIRRRTQRRWFIAAAASILVASIALLLTRNMLPPRPAIAGYTDRIVGVIERQSADNTWTVLDAEPTELLVGDRLRTDGRSRAGILLPDGVSLRLAGGTDMVFESATRLRVLSGRVYIDTGGNDRGPSPATLEIVTPLATATHVGTQFEVSYRQDAYRLRVREGRVRLRYESGAIESNAGEQLSIGAGGVLDRDQLRADDPEWAWTQEVAPGPQIDGRAVSELLAWVARETGKTVRYETPEVERKARTTMLHGSIRALAPLDALSVMLATTDLEHVLTEGDTILIRLRDYR